jgi:hypothetical protein
VFGKVLVVLAVLAGTSSIRPRSTRTSPAIFRYTKIEGDSIVLGEAWPGARRLGARMGDTLVVIPADRFGYADGMRVHLSSRGLVTQLEFFYGRRRDIARLVGEYIPLLGEPERRSSQCGRNAGTEARWSDGLTSFSIVDCTATSSNLKAVAHLVDLASTSTKATPSRSDRTQ